MELQRERRYNKKSMKRKKVIPMQQTLPPAAADAERHRQERRAFLSLSKNASSRYARAGVLVVSKKK